MTALDALKSFKKFMHENVASKRFLQKEGTNPPEYVHPYVELLHLPHKNFSPKDFQVPFILIGLDDATDDTNEHELNVRMTFGTYGGGFYTDPAGDYTDIPDSQGYIDLINIIEHTKLQLVMEGNIDGNCTVLKPFKYGTYDTEMTFPYWYGYLSCTLSIPATEYLTGVEDII